MASRQLLPRILYRANSYSERRNGVLRLATVYAHVGCHFELETAKVDVLLRLNIQNLGCLSVDDTLFSMLWPALLLLPPAKLYLSFYASVS